MKKLLIIAVLGLFAGVAQAADMATTCPVATAEYAAAKGSCAALYGNDINAYNACLQDFKQKYKKACIKEACKGNQSCEMAVQAAINSAIDLGN